MFETDRILFVIQCQLNVNLYLSEARLLQPKRTLLDRFAILLSCCFGCRAFVVVLKT